MSCSGWKTVKIGDIATVTKLAGFEFTKYFKYNDAGEIIAIRALNVKNGTFDLTDIKRIDRDISDNLTRSKLYKGDIVITYTGAKFGEVAIVKNNDIYHLAPNVAKVTANKLCNPYFLYSFFRGDNFRKQLSNYSGGSSQPTIPMSSIRQLSVTLPPIREQEKIASTLSCLDDKIEHNNRINKNLEEMAQAIFRSWFVDFEPFQDGEFEDSELGRIPKGWKIGNLNQIANYLNGLAMQKYRPESDEFLPVIKIKELNQGFSDSNSDKAMKNIPEQYIIDNGDVVFSWSGTLVVKIWAGGKGALNQHLFKVTSENYDAWYYYFWTLYHLDKFRAIASDKATTMGHIKRNNLSEAKIIIPDDASLKWMNKVMNPLLKQIIDLMIQISKLKDIRDTLLPKLMSGEIRIPHEEVQ